MPYCNPDPVRAVAPALRAALGLALALGLAAPAAADVYAWKTDDGVFAYTDDPKKIPARYAEEAVTVRDTRLEAYPRLTREDSQATRAVAARMEKRLEYLRRVNALDARQAAPRGHAAGEGRATVTVATGSAQAPTMDISVDEGSGPVVVEPILTKRDGKVRTRRSTLVTQGDRTLALIKGPRHNLNPNEDIYEEDDLLDDE